MVALVQPKKATLDSIGTKEEPPCQEPTNGGADEAAVQSICNCTTSPGPNIAADPGVGAQRGRLAVSPARAGGQAGYGCARGFDLGALTFEQGVALPRVQAGLTAGVFTIEGLAAGFNKVDHNDDGLLCFKDIGALSGDVGIWVYSYDIVDNNASSPGS